MRACLFACLAFAVTALGQPTLGVTNVVRVTSSPVFDLSGTYEGGDGIVDVTVRITHLGSGRLSGTGLAVRDDGWDRMTAAGPLRANCKWTPEPLLRVAFSGPIQGDAQGSYRLTGVGTFDNSMTPLFDVTTYSVACVRGIGCLRAGGGAFVWLDNGQWTLRLNASTDRNVISGLATVELRNGRKLTFSAQGRYDPRTDQSTIRLRGLSEAKGAMLTVRGEGAFNITSITGKMLGQTIMVP